MRGRVARKVRKRIEAGANYPERIRLRAVAKLIPGPRYAPIRLLHEHEFEASVSDLEYYINYLNQKFAEFLGLRVEVYGKSMLDEPRRTWKEFYGR